jgi:hypothetical protein
MAKKKGIPDWVWLVVVVVVLIYLMKGCNTPATDEQNNSSPPNTPPPAPEMVWHCDDDAQAFYTTTRDTRTAYLACMQQFNSTYTHDDGTMWHFDFPIDKTSITCGVTQADEVQVLHESGIDVYYNVTCVCHFKENCKWVEP